MNSKKTEEKKDKKFKLNKFFKWFLIILLITGGSIASIVIYYVFLYSRCFYFNKCDQLPRGEASEKIKLKAEIRKAGNSLGLLMDESKSKGYKFYSANWCKNHNQMIPLLEEINNKGSKLALLENDIEELKLLNQKWGKTQKNIIFSNDKCAKNLSNNLNTSKSKKLNSNEKLKKKRICQYNDKFQLEFCFYKKDNTFDIEIKDEERILSEVFLDCKNFKAKGSRRAPKDNFDLMISQEKGDALVQESIRIFCKNANPSSLRGTRENSLITNIPLTKDLTSEGTKEKCFDQQVSDDPSAKYSFVRICQKNDGDFFFYRIFSPSLEKTFFQVSGYCDPLNGDYSHDLNVFTKDMAEKRYMKTILNQSSICSKKLVERSTDAMKNGNLDEAKEAIDKALRVNQKDKATLLKASQISMELNKNIDAMNYLDKLIQQDPSIAIAYGLKGYINHNLGDTNTACKEFKKAISMGDEFTKKIFSDGSSRFNYCSLDGPAKDFGEKNGDEITNNSSNLIIQSDEIKCANGNYLIADGEKFCL